MTEESTLPALAIAISAWFPELRGRVLPVADTDVTAETMPELPICLMALVREGVGPRNTARTPHIIEEYVVDFWFKPSRYTNPQDGTDTPFWGYYDYDKIRNKLIANLNAWQTPRCGRLSYRGLDVDVNQYAVMLTFRFATDYFLSDVVDSDPPDGQPVLITSSICAPTAMYCPEDAPPEETDKCQ